MPAANDSFANATPITSYPFQDVTTTVGAGHEPDEPQPSAIGTNFVGTSLWYRCTPPAGAVRVDLSRNGSGTGRFVAVYTGSSIATLVPVYSITTPGPGPEGARPGVFYADGTTSYYVQVGEYGSFKVSSDALTVTVCLPRWFSWGYDDVGETAKGNYANGPASGDWFDLPPAQTLLPANTILQQEYTVRSTHYAMPAHLGTDEVRGACATHAGQVLVWGQLNGQLLLGGVFVTQSYVGSDMRTYDDGTFAESRSTPTPYALSYAECAGAIQADCDGQATFWLRNDGTLWAVGVNCGQFGDGSGAFAAASRVAHATPVNITPPGATIVYFVVGAYPASRSSSVMPGSVFALDSLGQLWFTGFNMSGAAGNGATAANSAPVSTWQQLIVRDASSIARTVAHLWFSGHICWAMDSASALYVWGGVPANNGSGSSETTLSPLVPTPVDQSPFGGLVMEVTATPIGRTVLGAAYGSAWVRDVNGALWGMGYNRNQVLGLGDNVNRTAPTAISPPGGAVLALARITGASDSMAVIDPDGVYTAVGQNRSGQVDASESGTIYSTFQQLVPLPGTLDAHEDITLGRVLDITLQGGNGIFALVCVPSGAPPPPPPASLAQPQLIG